MNGRATCANCFFYRHTGMLPHQTVSGGECRRFPPPTAEPEVPNRWPVVRFDGWCGEHLTTTRRDGEEE